MASGDWHRHLKQGGLFVAAGLTQLALDSGVFISVTAFGVPVVAGNIMGRLSGALLGFWLNGRYTFAEQGQARLSRRHQWRFAAMWSVLTAISTLALRYIASRHALEGAWALKPFVEAALAAVSFLVSRHWVYR